VKRVLIGLAAIAILVVGLMAVADATQNRADVVTSETSEVRYQVRTKGLDTDIAAVGLWAACQQTIGGHRSEGLPVALGDGQYHVTVHPALGEHDRRRLRGCIADGTIDRTWGSVLEVSDR
jgi:hypothetical protein